jgi:hypothetical protein
LLIEGGVDFAADNHYTVSGLRGDLWRIPTLGLSIGISQIAELQIDGGLYNHLSIASRNPNAPLAHMLQIVGDSTSDIQDLVIGTKIRLMSERANRTSFAIRFATKLPNASNESGLGLDTTDFYFSALLGKTVQSIRMVGNAGLGILADPVEGNRQNDVFTYGFSIARAVKQGVEVVGEINGRLNTPGLDKVDSSNLKMTLGGGMAVQRAVAEKWKKATGVTLVEAYGLTETSPAACIKPMDPKDYNGAIGLPIPSTDACLKDDDGNLVALGEVGELCIKGPQVMRGYWQRPEETAKVIDAEGWLHTGDMAKMDAEGFFYLVDRKKDMILVSGFNVYPNEVEDVIAGLEGVLEVAAIGVPDERSGEAVKVFVVKKDPALTEEKIKAYCRDNLTGYKQPRYIEFRTELPKTNVGKILRKELREPPQTVATH